MSDSNIERSQDYEDGALDALGYITDGREDLEDLTMRVAEKIGANIVARRKRERGAVGAIDAALELLDRDEFATHPDDLRDLLLSHSSTPRGGQ